MVGASQIHYILTSSNFACHRLCSSWLVSDRVRSSVYIVSSNICNESKVGLGKVNFRNLDCSWRTLVHLSSLDNCQLNSTFILSYCFLKTPYGLLIHPSRTLSKQTIEMESSGISNFFQLKEAQLSILISITVVHVRVIIGLSWISQYHCKNNCLNTGYSICLDGMWMNLYKEGHKRMVCARQPAALCLVQAAEFPFLAVFVQNHDVCLCVLGAF